MSNERHERAIKVMLYQIVQDYGIDVVSEWMGEKPASIYRFQNVNEDRYHMKAAHLRALALELARVNDLRAIKIVTPHTCIVSRLIEDVHANGTLKEENREAYHVLDQINTAHFEEDAKAFETACDALDLLAKKYRSEGRML